METLFDVIPFVFGTYWVVSGYTVQGGTSRKHIESRHVRFRA